MKDKLKVGALDIIREVKKDGKKNGLNPDNHDTETKRYSKLSLSLTKKEKEQIESYNKNTVEYKRMSISAMILHILDKEGVFKE